MKNLLGQFAEDIKTQKVIHIKNIEEDFKSLVRDIQNNPELLSSDDKSYFENCLTYLKVIEKHLNEQLNEFVLTMSFAK